MSLNQAIATQERLERAMKLTETLVEVINSDDLKLKINSVRSNTIGSQFWCIVGARESYCKAFIKSKWAGFSCSIDDKENLGGIEDALARSRESILAAITTNELSAERLSILFELLEHEVQHHGQLIRYFYANQIKFPQEFADRYALSQIV